MSFRSLLRSSRRKAPTVPVKLLPATERIEEECTPHYNPKHFYPIRLYEILNGRYHIAAKLGYGTGSTVGLARDLHQ